LSGLNVVNIQGNSTTQYRSYFILKFQVLPPTWLRWSSTLIQEVSIRRAVMGVSSNVTSPSRRDLTTPIRPWNTLVLPTRAGAWHSRSQNTVILHDLLDDESQITLLVKLP